MAADSTFYLWICLGGMTGLSLVLALWGLADWRKWRNRVHDAREAWPDSHPLSRHVVLGALWSRPAGQYPRRMLHAAGLFITLVVVLSVNSLVALLATRDSPEDAKDVFKVVRLWANVGLYWDALIALAVDLLLGLALSACLGAYAVSVDNLRSALALMPSSSSPRP